MPKSKHKSKGYGKLEDMALNAKITRLNYKWDIIQGMVEDADYREQVFGDKEIPEKAKIREAIQEYLRLEEIGYID